MFPFALDMLILFTFPSNPDTLMVEDVEMGETDVDALSPEPVKQFVAKADEAGVVVFVLSKAFASSITCKEQVGSRLYFIIKEVKAERGEK